MISHLIILSVLENKWARINHYSRFLPFGFLGPPAVSYPPGWKDRFKNSVGAFHVPPLSPSPPPLNHSSGHNEVNEMNDSAGRVNCEWCIMGAQSGVCEWRKMLMSS